MNSARLRDYLLLIRAPLAATAITDCLAAALLLQGGFQSTFLGAYILLALASFCCYSAGMSFNDIFDLERDRTLAPKRPLPSGRISFQAAVIFSCGLLLIALICSWCLGVSALWACLILIGTVVLYDGLLKKFRLPGSAAMASCRVANVFMAIAVVSPNSSLTELYWPTAFMASSAHIYATAIGLYVLGLTWHSTHEDDEAPKLSLVLISLLLFASLALLSQSLFQESEVTLPFRLLSGLGYGLLAANIVWRIRASWTVGTVASAGLTTKWLIRGLPLLASSAVMGQGFPIESLVLLLAYFPYILGARWLFRPPPQPAPVPPLEQGP